MYAAKRWVAVKVAASAFHAPVARCATLAYIGPVSYVWGWVVVSFFSLCVPLSMAEICAAFPTAVQEQVCTYGARAWQVPGESSARVMPYTACCTP
jgi:amino acid permease